MKKLKYLFVAAMVIAAVAATIFVGCKKEKDESLAQLDNIETEDIQSQIKAYQRLRESVNSGEKADGVMTVEEMRNFLDITVNYEHSQHMVPCVGKILDTLSLAMPCVDNEGNVTMADVVATYETLDTEIVKHMEMVYDGKDIPSYFSIVMPDETSSEENILVVFVRGVKAGIKEVKNAKSICDDDGPFVETLDDWYWGDSLGLCKPEPVNNTSDAAQQLSDEFEFVIPAGHQGENYYIWNVVHAIYRPCSIGIPDINSDYYVDPDMEDCADTWLFYYVSSNDYDLCLYWYQLNCFWRSINRNIVDPSAPLHYYPGPTPVINIPYHYCHINSYGFNDANYYYKVHAAHVIYCFIDWYETPGPPLN